jgi:hypothetical protein
MMLKRDDGTEKDYGGRNKLSIMKEIDGLLAEKGFSMPNSPLSLTHPVIHHSKEK